MIMLRYSVLVIILQVEFVVEMDLRKARIMTSVPGIDEILLVWRSGVATDFRDSPRVDLAATSCTHLSRYSLKGEQKRQSGRQIYLGRDRIWHGVTQKWS